MNELKGELRADELKNIVDEIFYLINRVQETERALISNGTIQKNGSDHKEILNLRNSLMKEANFLVNKTFTKIATDIQEPANKIIKATENLDKASDSLEGVRNFIASLTKITTIATRILQAISKGNPLLLVDLLP